MANRTTLQLYACAKASKQLMQKGMHSLKVEEIAEEAHGELWPVGKSEIEWVARHLRRIKDILVGEEDLTVLLTNNLYFSKYHRRQPATPELAKDLLPSKGKSKPAGLHLVTSENDTIWLASQERLGDVGVGVVKKYTGEVTKAIKENRLTSANGKKIVRELKDKM